MVLNQVLTTFWEFGPDGTVVPNEEFGTYEKVDMPSRVAYTRFVRDEAERRGIPWTFWEFASEFGVWSPKTGKWVEPLRRALLD